MATKLIQTSFAEIIALAAVALPAFRQLPNCDSARVNYTPFDQGYASKFLVEPLKDPDASLPQGERIFSPQHTRWLIEEGADYTKPGPWNTRFYIGTGDNRADSVLTVLDHGNSISAKWLNEKLLLDRSGGAASTQRISSLMSTNASSFTGRWPITVN